MAYHQELSREGRVKKESVWPNCLRKAFEAELDRSPLDRDTKQFLMGHPVPSKKYGVNEVEQKYLMCNLSRTKLDKLVVIRDFVRSLGIEELETKIKRVQAEAPQMTEEDALSFLVRTEFGGVGKANHEKGRESAGFKKS